MRYLKLIVLWGGLLLGSVSASAAQLADLYAAEVEVSDQGSGARSKGMSEAMAEVLLKVSGRSTVVDEEVLKSAMKNASRYVQQYRYRSASSDATGGKASSGVDNRLVLWVSFDSTSIDKLLRQYGFNVWSATRPTVLVWLAVEEGTRRVLVGANDQGLVRDVLDSESQRRALPIRLPLLDLTDQAKVKAVDVWGGFVDNIASASRRYETQAVLVGKLYAVGREWEARWTLSYQGNEHSWQQRGAGVRSVITSGVGGSCDYLSQRFAASSNLGSAQLALRIEEVTSMSDFRRAHDYLASLHGVTTVSLRRSDANAASFIVEFEGGKAGFLNAIEMGDVLMNLNRMNYETLPAVQAEGEDTATISIASDTTARDTAAGEQAGDQMATSAGDESLGQGDEGAPSLQLLQLEEMVYRLLP